MSTFNWKAPFFILGNPRSGTSLLRIMLDAHSKIVIPPECGFIEWLYDQYKNWDYSNIDNFLNDLYLTRKFETWKVPKNVFESAIRILKPENYQELCQTIYFAYAKTIGKSPEIWGDKNNYYVHKLEKIKLIFPNAKYIHIVRDGRDISVSYRQINESNFTSKYKPNLPNSIEEIANEWCENLSKINDFKNRINIKQFITVRYEDLLTQNHATLNKLTTFLNIPFDINMITYYSRNKKLSIEPAETLEWKMKTMQNIDLSRIGRYKKSLTSDEIKRFEIIAQQKLLQYNYL